VAVISVSTEMLDLVGGIVKRKVFGVRGVLVICERHIGLEEQTKAPRYIRGTSGFSGRFGTWHPVLIG
jgi:hypothetical protein